MAAKHKAGDRLVREVVEATISGKQQFQGTAIWNPWEGEPKSDIVFFDLGTPRQITKIVQDFREKIGPECEVFPESFSSDKQGTTTLVTVRFPRTDQTFEQRMKIFFDKISPLFGTIKVQHTEQKLICVEERGVIVFQVEG